MKSRVLLVRTDVSEKHTASAFNVIAVETSDIKRRLIITSGEATIYQLYNHGNG
jgi:hypothetical protein